MASFLRGQYYLRSFPRSLCAGDLIAPRASPRSEDMEHEVEAEECADVDEEQDDYMGGNVDAVGNDATKLLCY